MKDAVEALKRGRPVLLYDSDGREEETDIVVAGGFSSPENVRRMRRDGGGLICLALHPQIAKNLEIPFLTDVWRECAEKHPVFKALEANDIPYDEHSSFSISVNHRDTFTGISDRDRALTITELSKLGKRVLMGEGKEDFGKKFRSPGHVILLRAADGLVAKRRGHTELSVALMELADLTPVATICEMLGEDGNSLGKKDAERYAEEHGLVILAGDDVAEEYLKQKG